MKSDVSGPVGATYYTGIDPFTKKPVYIARQLRDRKLQRALLQFFKPENYFEVREALRQAGRTDLIGDGCDSLIPSRPPKEAIAARRQRANDPDHYHAMPKPVQQKASGQRGQTSPGYRPGRKTADRRSKRSRRNGGGASARP